MLHLQLEVTASRSPNIFSYIQEGTCCQAFYVEAVAHYRLFHTIYPPRHMLYTNIMGIYHVK